MFFHFLAIFWFALEILAIALVFVAFAWLSDKLVKKLMGH
jgi:hypothetical protein